LKESDLPDPADLLDGKARFQPTSARPDRTAAVLTSATSLVTSEKNVNQKRVGALWDIIADVVKATPDVALPASTTLCQKKLMVGHPNAFQALAKLEPAMRAAGMITG